MKRSLKLVICLLCLTIFLPACGGQKMEPTPMPTPMPIQPIQPVVEEPQISPLEACAADIVLPDEPAYPLVYCENFEDPDTVMMMVGEDENKWGALTLDVYNGKYTARVEVKRDNSMWLTVPVSDIRDFAFQVDGRLASHSGHPYHSWGVYFKADEKMENYYYFLVDNNQYYYFQLVRGDNLTNLINGRRSEDLNPLDEGNTITIVGDGDTYAFYINGKYQEEFSDNRLLSGTMGIYSEMRKDTTLDWEFDNLVLYAP
jgi:hypothetical protein